MLIRDGTKSCQYAAGRRTPPICVYNWLTIDITYHNNIGSTGEESRGNLAFVERLHSIPHARGTTTRPRFIDKLMCFLSAAKFTSCKLCLKRAPEVILTASWILLRACAILLDTARHKFLRGMLNSHLSVDGLTTIDSAALKRGVFVKHANIDGVINLDTLNWKLFF